MARPNLTLPKLDSADVRRFHELVEARSPDECWPWKASTFSGGYGQWKRGRRTLKSHRVAYFLHYHEDPGDQVVCHTCDNPVCCNPRHLFLGTIGDNVRDCAAKGRLPKFFGDDHWTHRKPELVRRGETHEWAKLTAAEVVSIRAAYLAGGVTHRELAERYSVNREAISNAIRGDNWAHLPIDRAATVAAGRLSRRATQRLHKAKLTIDQVRVIRRTPAGRGVAKRYAEQFGVTVEAVYAVLRGDTWKDVA